MNLIAAAHSGQCFALVGHRLQLKEDAVARGVTAIGRVLLPIIEQEVASPAGMADFLGRLANGRFSALLESEQAFGDSDLKMRGRDLAHEYLNNGTVTRDALETALDESGLTPDELARLLPHAIILILAAVQRRLEAPLREIVERTAGKSRKRVEGDRVTLVADLIRDGERLDTTEPPPIPSRLSSFLQRAMSLPGR